MARPGDFYFDNGTRTWLQFQDSTNMAVLPDSVQSYLNERYEGVRGTGVSQVFIPFAEDNLAPVNKKNVEERLEVDVLKTKPSPLALHPLLHKKVRKSVS